MCACVPAAAERPLIDYAHEKERERPYRSARFALPIELSGWGCSGGVVSRLRDGYGALIYWDSAGKRRIFTDLS